MRKSSLFIIFLVVFLDLLGFGMVIPILPYYAKSFGATATTLGWLMVCYSGMQLLFSPFWGRISDRVGRRLVLLTCIAGLSLSMFILGLASSLTWLFIGRLLAGFFGANISTAAAYIADITPPENRAKGMGMIGAAFGLGFLFGPAIGGLLSKWGYGTAAFAAAGLSAANFFFALMKLGEPKLSLEERAKHRNRFTARMWKETLTVRTTGLPIILFFLITTGVAQVEVSFALYLLERFQLDAQHAGMILALVALSMAAIQGGAIGTLTKNFGEATLVMAGVMCMAVGLLGAVRGPTIHYFIGAFLFYGLGYGLINPSLSSLVSRFARPGAQGATMGIYQSAGSLARIVGPLLAGALFDFYGIKIPFYFAVGMCLIALLFVVSGRSVWNFEQKRCEPELVMES
ncbi:MAG: MFS transporter [Deltaproteobacteria bacterium]|nr:MFS transporter [Deltaproteobacteria bacterium]